MLRLIACALVLGSLGVTAAAHACTRPEPRRFEVDAALRPLDRQPPTAPGSVTGVARRSAGEFCQDGKCASSTCGSMAWVSLELTPAIDDRTADDDVGYRLRYLEGTLPSTLAGPLDDVAVGSPHWSLDFSYDDIVHLDATFEVVAIDRAGNVSAPSAPFHVAFDGCTRVPLSDACLEDVHEDAGCSVTGSARTQAPALGLDILALVAGVLWRRRR